MTTPADDSPDSPVEAYLDELVVGLPRSHPRDLRRMLAEAEAHLRDDVDAGLAAGLTQREAEVTAVQRLGPPRLLVEGEQRRLRPSLGVLARQFATTGLLLGGIGGVAIGVSGVLAWLVRLAAGARVLVDVEPGRVLSAADCARWLAADPGAHSCRDAAVADWVYEVVGYRLILGVLGMVALAVFVLLRHRWVRQDRWSLLPPEVSDTVAAVSFGLAGAWTLGLGINALVIASGHGSGQWFSAAAVALLVAAYFAVRLLRDLRRPRGQTGDLSGTSPI
jgi:hypothetical protein